MNDNGAGPEPELPIASTHDVNLLEVTHGLVPTVEPERSLEGLTRNDDETTDEFSLRIAVHRRQELEKRKGLEQATNGAVHPLQKFARVWDAS